MTDALIATCSGWSQIQEKWLDPFANDGDVYVMIEDIAHGCFDTLVRVRSEVLRDPPWPKGRIFSARCELRWRKRFGRWHAVFVTDDSSLSLPAGFDQTTNVTLEQIDEDKILLWGEKDPGGRNVWFEDRIPRDLEYPCQGSGMRAMLSFRTYRVTEKNVETFGFYHRWCGVGSIP